VHGCDFELVQCSFYLRRGTAFIPTMARTTAGYWLGVEPVVVQSVGTAEHLQTILAAAILRGSPVVPTPTRADFPPDVMRKYCGMKSFSAFERTSALWSISKGPEGYCICQWLRSLRHRGAWEQDTHGELLLPVHTPVEDVARRAAAEAMSLGHHGSAKT
jgi:hypothetical protein